MDREWERKTGKRGLNSYILSWGKLWILKSMIGNNNGRYEPFTKI